MVIPFIAAVMRDVFNLVPSMLKESAYGVGATTWEVVKKVVLPYTKIGVVGGVMLGLGRALGKPWQLPLLLEMLIGYHHLLLILEIVLLLLWQMNLLKLMEFIYLISN